MWHSFLCNFIENFLMNTLILFMKRNYKIILVILGLSVSLWSFMPKKVTIDPNKDKALIDLLMYVINNGHYSPAEINDTFSKGVYKSYLEALDPSKRFFIQSDIDEFTKYEVQIDDQIKNRDLTFFDLTYKRLMQRMKESKNFYKFTLIKPIDYNIDESFNVDYEKAAYCKSLVELMEKWRKQIKLSTLSTLVDKLKVEENRKNGIVDTIDKPSALKKIKAKDKSEPKSYEQLEKESRTDAMKSLDQYYENTEELDRDDWFSLYINSIAERFDPHTSYFAPEAKERFDVDISGTLEGIGARLQKKDDLVEISELISGGPAWRGKELESGDLIMKVAQYKEEGVDVVEVARCDRHAVDRGRVRTGSAQTGTRRIGVRAGVAVEVDRLHVRRLDLPLGLQLGRRRRAVRTDGRRLDARRVALGAGGCVERDIQSTRGRHQAATEAVAVPGRPGAIGGPGAIVPSGTPAPAAPPAKG